MADQPIYNITVNGDFVQNKTVEHEIGNVEAGGIGIQINNGADSSTEKKETPLPEYEAREKAFASACEKIQTGDGVKIKYANEWALIEKIAYELSLICKPTDNTPFVELLDRLKVVFVVPKPQSNSFARYNDAFELEMKTDETNQEPKRVWTYTRHHEDDFQHFMAVRQRFLAYFSETYRQLYK